MGGQGWRLGVLTSRLILAVVFAVAGVAKLMDRRTFIASLAGFGLPRTAASAAAVVLPLLELAVTAALVSTRLARWGALGALVLLLAFIVAITVNLWRGKRPDCACFGQLHSRPVGGATLARNGVLAALAAYVAVAGWRHPGPSATAWMDDLSGGQIAIGVTGAFLVTLAGFQTWLFLRLLRQHGRLLLRVESLEAATRQGEVGGDVPSPEYGLAPGSRAPDFALPTPHGSTVTLDDLLAKGRPVLLVFSNPGCGPCDELMPDVARWQVAYIETLTLAVVSTAAPDAAAFTVLLQEHNEVAKAYACPGTPSAVLIGPEGKVAAPLAAGADPIRRLLADTVEGRALPAGSHDRRHHARVPPRVGDPAPTVRLPDLTDTVTDLDEFRPDPVLLVFWDPRCGFCQRLLPELSAWQAERSGRSPRLVLVSRGSAEQNRVMDLTSPVLLDESLAVRSAFGVPGTPSAVLIDGQGRIASEPGIGGAGVMRLARTAADSRGNVGSAGGVERELARG